LGYEFTALPFSELLSRLLRSGYDFSCYRKMCEDLYSIEEAKLQLKEYDYTKKDAKAKSIERLAKKCAEELPKFRGDFGHYNWEDAVIETVANEKIPSKWYSYIFGQVSDEKELYPSIMKFLKKNNQNELVYDTANVRSSLVRFADFTVAKKGLFGMKIISFDAKTKASSFEYFLNQARDFQRFSDLVYLVATPALILEAGRRYGKGAAFAQRNVLKKLKESDIGMYVIDATTSEMRLLLDAEETGTDKEAKTNALRLLKIK
jgi:hypothetical protein